MAQIICVLLALILVSNCNAASFPLLSQSTTSRFELVDRLTLNVLSATAAFDATKKALRYSMLTTPKSGGTQTTVTSLTNFTRYTFTGVWSSACSVLSPPSASSSDVKYAIAALVATGAAVLQTGVSNVLQTGNATSNRNVATSQWVARGSTLNINTTSCSLDITWDFSTTSWILMPAAAGSGSIQLIAFSVLGTCDSTPISLLGNVAYTSWATPNSLLFQPLGTCNATMPWIAAAKTTGALTPAPPLLPNNPFPMPTLPTQFSALIQATFLERSTTFNLYESYAGSYARATFMWPSSAKTVVVDGTSGVAYVQSQASGLTSAWSDPTSADGTFTTRQFFTSAACSKTVFAYQLMTSISDVLAKTTAYSPRYMGKVVVRGISTSYWRASSGSQTYTWYFANSSYSFPTNSTIVAASQLVRVTATGTGISPFFVAHPFLQRWLPTPDSSSTYCSTVMDIAPDVCLSQTFAHIYDFMSYVPSVDSSEVAVPSTCTSDTTTVVTTTPDCPPTTSGWSIFLLFVLAALFGGTIGALIMYCRAKRNASPEAMDHEDD